MNVTGKLKGVKLEPFCISYGLTQMHQIGTTFDNIFHNFCAFDCCVVTSGQCPRPRCCVVTCGLCPRPRVLLDFKKLYKLPLSLMSKSLRPHTSS